MANSRYVLALIPLVLLGALLYFAPPSLIGLSGVEVPVESLTFDRVVLEPGLITVEIVNGGPSEVTIAQIFINEAIWGGYIESSDSIPRLGRTTLFIPYDWVEAEVLQITLLSSNAIKFEHEIEAAVATPVLGINQIANFALIGVYVGIVPVFLGMAWFPFLKKLAKNWYNFFLSLTVGLLIFLAVDALLESTKTAASIPSVFQGPAIIIFGIAASFLGLQFIAQRTMRGPAERRSYGMLPLAYMIALGIGLHNLGEGLAIGSAYALGEVALGASLILGFTLHNITEGIVIVSPLSKGRLLTIPHLVMLGLLAGGPTIFGTMIGGFAFTSFWGTLFLAIAVGAVLQVIFEISRLAIGDGLKGWLKPMNLAGVFVGFAIMYVTALAVPS